MSRRRPADRRVTTCPTCWLLPRHVLADTLFIKYNCTQVTNITFSLLKIPTYKHHVQEVHKAEPILKSPLIFLSFFFAFFLFFFLEK